MIGAVTMIGAAYLAAGLVLLWLSRPGDDRTPADVAAIACLIIVLVWPVALTVAVAQLVYRRARGGRP